MALCALASNLHRMSPVDSSVKAYNSQATKSFTADFTSLVIMSSRLVLRLSIGRFCCSTFDSSLPPAANSPDHGSLSWFNTTYFTKIGTSPLPSLLAILNYGSWEVHMEDSGFVISGAILGCNELIYSCRLSPGVFLKHFLIKIRRSRHTSSSEHQCKTALSWG